MTEQKIENSLETFRDSVIRMGRRRVKSKDIFDAESELDCGCEKQKVSPITPKAPTEQKEKAGKPRPKEI